MTGRSNDVPYVPHSAPFSAEQRAWLNGYFAGLFANASEATAATLRAQAPKPLLILYGSQTGTAEGLARRVGIEAGKHNHQARVLEMSRFAELDLKKETRLLIVTSTWGDGDPPDNAAAFWSYLSGSTAPELSGLDYSVLALGDRNYTDFCGAGRKFDERLEQLGARRVHPRADCDTDYEATVRTWLDALWPALSEGRLPSRDDSAVSVVEPLTQPNAGSVASGYSRANPFAARLLAKRNLNGPGSAKETHHLEFSLAGSGLVYQPGDALGVMPANCPELVGGVLEALGCDGEEAVLDSDRHETSLRNALLRHYQITAIPQTLIEAAGKRGNDSMLRGMLAPENKAELDQFVYGRDLLDFLRAFPELFKIPRDFTAALRKLQPRLYSISSSPKAHPDEVHITVGGVRYETHGRARQGVCSIFLADRVAIDGTAPVFIQPSPGFRLPQLPETPVIMIGPGTGIAPFRAFLEERQITGPSGQNWLFFGDQCQATDFLYREQLQVMIEEGHLARLDTAFSRDQEKKIYVQDRMLENAATFWDWLEGGAHVYVCGDAKRMARDVETALHKIIIEAGAKTPDQAIEYVANLKAKKRYQRDVY
jgi:sulfite reductase (NADPH) flavoprotein alpha-component